MLHQSIIGLETKAALDKYGIKADIWLPDVLLPSNL